MKRKRDIQKLRQTQGCLTDCVAFILNIHPQNVPYFVYPREGWNERLKAFFKKHGYQARWNKIELAPLKKSGLQIVCGNSLRWKTAAHAVVYRGKKMVYDPQHPSRWSEKRITHRLILTKQK